MWSFIAMILLSFSAIAQSNHFSDNRYKYPATPKYKVAGDVYLTVMESLEENDQTRLFKPIIINIKTDQYSFLYGSSNANKICKSLGFSHKISKKVKRTYYHAVDHFGGRPRSYAISTGAIPPKIKRVGLSENFPFIWLNLRSKDNQYRRRILEEITCKN